MARAPSCRVSSLPPEIARAHTQRLVDAHRVTAAQCRAAGLSQLAGEYERCAAALLRTGAPTRPAPVLRLVPGTGPEAA